MQDIFANSFDVQTVENQRRKAQARREDYLCCLHEILETETGCRFFKAHLKRLGHGRQLGAEDLPLYNLGIELLRDMAEANHLKTKRILWQIYAPDPDQEER